MRAENLVTLKFNVFEVVLNSSSPCQYLKNHSCLTLYSIFGVKIKNTGCQGIFKQNCDAKYCFLIFVPSQFLLISLLKFEITLLFHGSCKYFQYFHVASFFFLFFSKGAHKFLAYLFPYFVHQYFEKNTFLTASISKVSLD